MLFQAHNTQSNNLFPVDSVPTKAETRLPTPSPAFGWFAWAVLLFNLLVIAVGVVVRATGSGDGCGAHWPACDGEIIPVAPSVEKMIEYTHRLVSGVDGLLVLGLAGWCIAKFRHNKPLLGAVLATVFFTGVEAWLGAYLVKQRLVADNASVQRAVWMSIHLVNTFFLLTALSLAAWWASGRDRIKTGGQGAVGLALALAFIAMVALGVSGSVTALGDTLFPAQNHEEAMRQSLAPGAHFLQKLRILHPSIAGSVGLYLLLIAGLVGHLRPSAQTKRYATAIYGLFFVQMGVGFLNVLLAAPVWMQLVHLLLADLVWIAVTLFSAAAMEAGVPRVEMNSVPATQYATGTFSATERPTYKDYILLTKPRVISLLLFTTLAAMFIAAKGWPGAILFWSVALGGYLSAGAANAINMVIDRDIDGRMKRTSQRPTVTQKIPSRDALFFGLGLAVLSFAILWGFANLLAALLSLAGLVFYVCVYTLFLKRRTWHNIVIGGAAGAFPPLVGWAAVTNSLSPLAWYLFAIILVWTPAHFWALALLIKDDYAEAGVPMLPVVLGDRVTVIQIALYAVLTAVVSILPLAQGLVGPGYVIAAALLNVILVMRSAQLARRTDRPRALSMYKYSMLYLALLFLAMALDQAKWGAS
ncbi:MAG: protoheme IX farnesyltransferase [Cytophagales bacterium]|nr:protoheme IX farnesyltransferase [Armatimonadota bacterium]